MRRTSPSRSVERSAAVTAVREQPPSTTLQDVPAIAIRKPDLDQLHLVAFLHEDERRRVAGRVEPARPVVRTTETNGVCCSFSIHIAVDPSSSARMSYVPEGSTSAPATKVNGTFTVMTGR